MNIELSFAWMMLLMLGIFHGINPGMGWLFAVGLGLQEQQRSAVWRALLPLALGHALAVGAAVVAALLVGEAVPNDVLKWAVAATLFVFGVYRLFRHRHPRYGGMRMKARHLTVWSFLMATAHGAGLMVMPFVFAPAENFVPAEYAADGGHDMAGGTYGMVDAPHRAHQAHVVEGGQAIHSAGSEMADAGGGHAAHAHGILEMLPAEPTIGLLVTIVHTLGYLLIMGAIAVIVYEKLGLRLLRTAWINLDLIWAGVLILTAIATPFL